MTDGQYVLPKKAPNKINALHQNHAKIFGNRNTSMISLNESRNSGVLRASLDDYNPKSFATLQEEEKSAKSSRYDKENKVLISSRTGKGSIGQSLDFDTYKQQCDDLKSIIPTKKQEKPSIEDECSICLQLMVEPCKLQCDHRFCTSCLKQVLTKQSSCPLCRIDIPKDYPIEIDKEFQQSLRNRHTNLFIQRQESITQKRQQQRQQQKKIKFIIGNKYEYSKNVTSSCKVHNWTAFVQLQQKEWSTSNLNKLISKVKFTIQTPFGVETKEVYPTENGEISLNEWSQNEYKLAVTIYWKKQTGLGRSITVKHDLCFRGQGQWNSFNVRLKDEQINDLVAEFVQ